MHTFFEFFVIGALLGEQAQRNRQAEMRKFWAAWRKTESKFNPAYPSAGASPHVPGRRLATRRPWPWWPWWV